MTSLEREQPDILIRCAHGGDAPGTLAAKYQWAPSQGVWVPVSVRGKINVTITNLRGNSVDDWWMMKFDPANEPDPGLPLRLGPDDKRPLREHHEIRCGAKYCRNKVAGDNGHIRWLFELIVSSIARAAKSDQRDWVYLLADLAIVDDRGNVVLTLDGLRAALALNKAKFGRHVGLY